MTPPSTHRLSKSKVAAFEHCPLRLWLQVHHRELAEHDEDTLARFQFGHEVGRKAQFLQPSGILVEALAGMKAAIERTRELLASDERRPIFEGTFVHEGVLVRVDVLEPGEDGSWQAVEVKATNNVRSHHLADLATQLWVMNGAGVAISRAIIRHVFNRIDWQRPDASLVRFQDEDVTARIKRYVRERPAVVSAAIATATLSELHVEMGPRCRRPFSCEFQRHCTARRDVPLIARTDSVKD